MNSGQIVNCQRCGQIFRKARSDLCPVCLAGTQETTHRLYHFIQNHPHVSLGEAARQCNVSLQDAESLLFEGGLGTAAFSLRVNCHRCGKLATASQFKGRFCLSCAQRMEEESRLSATSQDDGWPTAEKTPGEPLAGRGRRTFRAGNAEGLTPIHKGENGHPQLDHPPAQPSPVSNPSFGFKRGVSTP